MKRIYLIVTLLLLVLSSCASPGESLVERSPVSQSIAEASEEVKQPVIETTIESPIMGEITTPTNVADTTPAPTSEPVVEVKSVKWRYLDSFSTEAVKNVSTHVTARGSYTLSADKIVNYPNFALYIVIQNIDTVTGKFRVSYMITTADKDAAIKLSNIQQKLDSEMESLKREYFSGTVEIILAPMEYAVFILPPGGIPLALDRVPYNQEHSVIAKELVE